MTESDRIVVMENRKFTNTALPVFSGTEGWYQHIHIVQAIVKSNGVAVICASARRGVECGSPSDEGGAGVMDGTGGWTDGILPVSWQTGGSEKAVQERGSPTGIGPGYVCN